MADHTPSLPARPTYTDDGCDDDGGSGGNGGGGKPVSVVALVFQESRERRRPVLATLMNYNQFALSFLKLDN